MSDAFCCILWFLAALLSSCDGAWVTYDLDDASPGHPGERHAAATSLLGRQRHHVRSRSRQVKAKAAEVAQPALALDDFTLQKKFQLNRSSFQELLRSQQQFGHPNLPPVELNDLMLRQVTSSDRGFHILRKAYEFVRPLRRDPADIVASLLMIGDAENCLMKLAYSTYSMDDEDDYPYLPRKCGDDFRWDTGNYF